MTDRNDTLHKNENILFKEQENKLVNKSIEDIYFSMPSNAHILIPAEKRFFRGASSKEEEIGKGTMTKKANSILVALWK